MTATLLLLVFLDGGGSLSALADPALGVREQAVEELARGGPPTTELAEALFHDDARIATGVAEALERRRDPAALAPLLRAAAHEETERGRVAARALVRIAFATNRPVPATPQARASRRLQAAVAAETRAHLAALRGWRADDQPQLYRPILAGERYAEAALRALLLDPHAPPLVRDHAAAAYSRLVGAAAAPLFTQLLADAEPRVRWAAAAYVARLDDRTGLETLARVLERPGAHRRLLPYAAAAAQRTGVLSEVAARRLAQLVRSASLELALPAAAALARHRPQEAHAAVGLRVRAFLRSDANQPGAGAPAARFLVRGLPLDEAERERCRASGSALLRAAAETDRARALESLRPVLAPERPLGIQESLRVRVVRALLLRHDAPPQDRLAFARRALESDASLTRASALDVLRGLPPDVLAPLEPRLRRALEDVSESVRVAAADLLAPDPRALLVLAIALYDGHPAHARTAAARLKGVDPEAAPAQRRRLAREWMARIAALLRDKD